MIHRECSKEHSFVLIDLYDNLRIKIFCFYVMTQSVLKEYEIMKTDTIAAIATAMTNSGIGIIRISGEDAFYGD